MFERSTSRRPRHARRGLAVVEFAVCAPLLLSLCLGAIELANFIHLRQVLTVAAYECALRVTSSGGTQAAARTQAKLVLSSYDINDATIKFTPAVNAKTPTGTLVKVSISINTKKYANVGVRYFQGATVDSDITMMRL